VSSWVEYAEQNWCLYVEQYAIAKEEKREVEIHMGCLQYSELDEWASPTKGKDWLGLTHKSVVFERWC
jgi:hypothetical protein